MCSDIKKPSIFARAGAKFPEHKIRIGLLGPRIQCLGAIVCASRNPDKFELIYDHPKPYAPVLPLKE